MDFDSPLIPGKLRVNERNGVVPCPLTLHSFDLGVSVYDPGLQLWQASRMSVPVDCSLEVPAGHTSQLVAPVPGAAVPLGQYSHELAPESLPYLPISHAVHVSRISSPVDWML